MNEAEQPRSSAKIHVAETHLVDRHSSGGKGRGKPAIIRTAIPFYRLVRFCGVQPIKKQPLKITKAASAIEGERERKGFKHCLVVCFSPQLGGFQFLSTTSSLGSNYTYKKCSFFHSYHTESVQFFFTSGNVLCYGELKLGCFCTLGWWLFPFWGVGF